MGTDSTVLAYLLPIAIPFAVVVIAGIGVWVTRPINDSGGIAGRKHGDCTATRSIRADINSKTAHAISEREIKGKYHSPRSRAKDNPPLFYNFCRRN
jgi:hypothetical protein